MVAWGQSVSKTRQSNCLVQCLAISFMISKMKNADSQSPPSPGDQPKKRDKTIKSSQERLSMVERLSGDKRMLHHLSIMNSVQKLSIIPSITVVHLDFVWLEIGLHSKYGTKREWSSYRALEMESNLPIQIKFLSAKTE